MVAASLYYKNDIIESMFFNGGYIMKKSISLWSFAGQSVRDCIKLAKDAGFEGIELVLDETGEIGLETSEKKLLSIRKYADNLGIKIHSIATGLYWSYSFASEDGSQRNKEHRRAGTAILKTVV